MAVDVDRDHPAVPFLEEEIGSCSSSCQVRPPRNHARDVHIMSLAFLFVFSAYGAAHNLQSTVNTMDWNSMFDAQMTDFANETNRVRRRRDSAIADLKRRLRDARTAMENDLAAARRNCIPFGEYSPPENSDFEQQCWTEYLNACQVLNGVSAARSERTEAQAVKAFGDVVRRRRIVDFIMEDEERRSRLVEFVKSKIEQLESVRHERQANRLRGLLAAAVEPPPAQIPPP